MTGRRVIVGILLGALWLGAPAAWAEAVVPQSREALTLSFAPVVKQVAPAVVSIYADRVVRQDVSPFQNDPLFAMMFGQQPGMGLSRERVESALGSGVIVREDGLIVTNSHVVKDAQDIKVVLNDRREFPATVVTVDAKTDLAVLRIKVGDARLPVLPLGDSDQLEVGDLVLAIGNPFGVGQTVTSGIVSATARAAGGINDYGYFIQTDAAINPGNSGGALVDMAGRLIGINTAIYSRTGGSLGIGFAVPVNMVKTVVVAGETGRRAVRPWLGVGVQTVTADLAASLGLDRPAGVLVKSLRPGSPLAEAGLKTGDVILTVNGQAVDSPESMQFRIGTLSVGGQAEVRYRRSGTPVVVQVPLVAPPEVPAREATTLRQGSPLAGATVANLSPAVAEDIGYTGAAEGGVIVTAVQDGSPAAFLGLEKGDLLLAVNRQETASVADFTRQFNDRTSRWLLKIRRGDQVVTMLLNG